MALRNRSNAGKLRKPAEEKISEKEVQREFWREFGSHPDMTVFRRNVGVFRHLYSESKIKIGEEGEPDIQGWITRYIPVSVENNNSVFQPVALPMKVMVAQALAIETKSPAERSALLRRIENGKMTKRDLEQMKWRDWFVRCGGLYILACSNEDVYAGIAAPLKKIR